MLGNIKKREKILGIATVCLVAAALAYNFIIEPLGKRWNDSQKEIQEKEALLRRHSRILRSKDTIKKLHSIYTAYIQEEKMSSEEESAQALSSIEKLARSSNTRITNIKPLATKSLENHNKYTFRVSIESRVNELTKFIYDMQSSEQLLKVERMVLRAKERQPDTIKAILTISKISVF